MKSYRNFNLLTIMALAMVTFLSFFAAQSLYAQAAAVVPAVDNSDIGAILLNLATNFKTLSPIAIAMLAVNLIIGVLKSDALNNLFKNIKPLLKLLILAILGQIAGILTQVVQGKSWGASIVFGLVTSGGAMALYEAYNAFKKQAAVS